MSKLRSKLHSTSSQAKCAEGLLKSKEDCRSLHRQLVDQEQLTNFAKRTERMETTGAEIVLEACRKGFFMGFKRCKLMVLAYLFNIDTELPRTNPSNESLEVMVDDHVKMLVKILKQLPSRIRFHQATQTDSKACYEENRTLKPE